MGSEDETLCLNVELWSILCVIIVLFFLIASIIASYKFIQAYHIDKELNKSHVSMSKMIIIVSITLVVSGLVSMLNSIAFFGNCLIDGVSYNRPLSNALAGLCGLFHLISVVFVFLNRLYHVFNGTSYAYSKKTFIYLVGLCIISATFAISGMLILAVLRNMLGLIFISIGFLIYIFVSLVTLGLFVYGLYKVSLYVI